VLRLLRASSVRMLGIDELHNVLAGRGDRRRGFLNLLRFLGNELRIPLVRVGIGDAYLAVRADGQLENRFAPLTRQRYLLATEPRATSGYAQRAVELARATPHRDPIASVHYA
jgi:hypothetical protein